MVETFAKTMEGYNKEFYVYRFNYITVHPSCYIELIALESWVQAPSFFLTLLAIPFILLKIFLQSLRKAAEQRFVSECSWASRLIRENAVGTKFM